MGKPDAAIRLASRRIKYTRRFQNASGEGREGTANVHAFPRILFLLRIFFYRAEAQIFRRKTRAAFVCKRDFNAAPESRP